MATICRSGCSCRSSSEGLVHDLRLCPRVQEARARLLLRRANWRLRLVDRRRDAGRGPTIHVLLQCFELGFLVSDLLQECRLAQEL